MMDLLERVSEIQEHAAEQGFDWPATEPMWDKLQEEISELQAAISVSADACEDEIGDVLFMVVNIARHLHLSPQTALARSLQKFQRRFAYVMEASADFPREPEARLGAMEARWQQAKAAE